MLKIRLQRVGRKHEPTFRLVLSDSKNSTKSGRIKEILGSYDPRKTTEKLDADRVKYWLSTGAQPTDTVHNLLINQKIIEGKKKNVLPKKTFTTAPAAEAPVQEETPTPVEEAPVETVEEPNPSE
jgi:small subunit ribosomal protein S16